MDRRMSRNWKKGRKINETVEEKGERRGSERKWKLAGIRKNRGRGNGNFVGNSFEEIQP